jgi:hypothetical protein
MSEQELSEILKYSSPTAILVVTWNNVLKQLFCPFKVVVKNHIGELQKGKEVWVESVKVTVKLTTVFIVDGRAYYFYHFEILDPE